VPTERAAEATPGAPPTVTPPAPSPAPANALGLEPRHVGLVAWFATRFALRTGGGLVYLLAAILTGLGVAGVFITPVEHLVETDALRERGYGREDVGTLSDEILRSGDVSRAVRGITDADQAQADYLLLENPALLSAIGIVLLLIFPFLACFGAFNQTSGDIGSRGMRYLLLRTERANVYFGRFLGTYLFMALNTIGLMAIVVAYVGFKLHAYPAGALVVWGLQVTAALCLLALPYAAMCAWMSAAIDAPAGALVLSLLLAGFPIGFLAMVGNIVRPGVGIPWLSKLLPWGWKYHLLAHDVLERLTGYGMMAAFAAVFLALGLRTFLRRDL
jgi:hypothetical protein